MIIKLFSLDVTAEAFLFTDFIAHFLVSHRHFIFIVIGQSADQRVKAAHVIRVS